MLPVAIVKVFFAPVVRDTSYILTILLSKRNTSLNEAVVLTLPVTYKLLLVSENGIVIIILFAPLCCVFICADFKVDHAVFVV